MMSEANSPPPALAVGTTMNPKPQMMFQEQNTNIAAQG